MTESKLRFWEIALLFALAAALMWGSWSLQQQDRLERKMIRLHVIANSDSEADQVLKLQVRDRVLTLFMQSAPKLRRKLLQQPAVQAVGIRLRHANIFRWGQGKLQLFDHTIFTSQNPEG